MKTLINNGMVIDGSGSPGYPGAVALENDRIVGVGAIDPAGFDKVVDAKGCVISPGFIDTHSHSDVEVFNSPQLAPKIMQGITTEFLGQDGTAVAPCPEEYIGPWKKYIGGLDGVSDKLDWNFKTTDNYLKQIEKNGSGTNLCYLLPHGNVRMEARGLGSGLATPQELDKMRQVMERDIAAGVFGFSGGLIYMPNAYADTNEVTELCKIAAKHNIPFVVHQRSEADSMLESMDEIISVGRNSGVWVHFSHFKICGKNNAHIFNDVLKKLDDAKKEGIRVSFDQYPYVAGSTQLGVILPGWVHDGGTDKLLERLNNPEDRKRITHDIKNGIKGWDNFVAFAGLDGIFVTDTKTDKNKDVIGKNLLQLGEMKGKDPLEATYDLLYQEGNAVSMVDFYGLEEHVKAFIARPEQNVCTDGLLGGTPHPRVYGAFPRVLGKYVREENVIPLEEAVRKMTGRSAEVFNVKERGLLKSGYFADIVVFDPATIIDKGTYTDPRQYPEGICHVVVNGQFAVSDGKLQDGVMAGKVLRK